MIIVEATNVGQALAWGICSFERWERHDGHVLSPRGAATVEAPEPVCTVYDNPTERVLFSPTRDANPFFHFFEGLWMLAGRNDLATMLKFNKGMAQYSDDGEYLHGAYGFRWREWFGFDQIDAVLQLLRKEPDSRRAVIAMWSPNGDTIMADGGVGGINCKDVPCNTHLYFKVRQDKLHMTVCNRSNDMIWGAYGANAVHMSMLQEYMANKLGVGVGIMRQMSDSLHIYLPPHRGGEVWQKMRDQYEAGSREFGVNHYTDPNLKPFPIGAHHLSWDDDLRYFFLAMDAGVIPSDSDFETEFFARVVHPLYDGWLNRSVESVDKCVAGDWRKAAREWLLRRKDAKDVGVSV